MFLCLITYYKIVLQRTITTKYQNTIININTTINIKIQLSIQLSISIQLLISIQLSISIIEKYDKNHELNYKQKEYKGRRTMRT